MTLKQKNNFPPKRFSIKIRPSFEGCQQKIGSFLSISLNALVVFWGSLIKAFLKILFLIFGFVAKMIGRFLHIKISEWGETWCMFFRMPAIWLMWSMVSILCVFSLMAGTHYGAERAWMDFRGATYEQR